MEISRFSLRPQLFFDTGFYRRFIGVRTASSFDIAFFGSRNKALFPFIDTGRLHRTPFAFLEWVGISERVLKCPTPPDAEELVANLDVPALYQFWYDFFKTVPELQTEELRAAVLSHRKWVAAHRVKLWEASCEDIVASPECLHMLCEALAFDRVHNHVGDATPLRELHDALAFHGFISNHLYARNGSKFRLARRIWDRVWREKSESDRHFLKGVQDAMSIASHHDYADCDLIHLACLGYERHEKARLPVACFTFDEAAVLVHRISCYRGLIKATSEMYPTMASQLGFPSDYDRAYNGVVFCLSHDGSLKDTIDVATDTLPYKCF
ncbi:MAG: hypothetical protein ACAI34_22610 [Verrucomicrobium sp.]